MRSRPRTQGSKRAKAHGPRQKREFDHGTSATPKSRKPVTKSTPTDTTDGSKKSDPKRVPGSDENDSGRRAARVPRISDPPYPERSNSVTSWNVSHRSFRPHVSPHVTLSYASRRARRLIQGREVNWNGSGHGRLWMVLVIGFGKASRLRTSRAGLYEHEGVYQNLDPWP